MDFFMKQVLEQHTDLIKKMFKVYFHRKLISDAMTWVPVTELEYNLYLMRLIW